MFKGLCERGDLWPVPQRTGPSNTVYTLSKETVERKSVLILKCLRAFWSTLLGLHAFQEPLSAAQQQ